MKNNIGTQIFNNKKLCTDMNLEYFPKNKLQNRKAKKIICSLL